MLRDKFGNRCNQCGYNKCQAALHFVPVDRSRGTGGISIQNLKEHPEEYELVCANCHIEIFFGESPQMI